MIEIDEKESEMAPQTDYRESYGDDLTTKAASEVKDKKIRELDDFTEDTILNRPIKIRGYHPRHAPQGETGKIYYDKENKKLKIYIDKTGGWADILWTTTSTSSSTSSSTSTSTSTTTS